MGPAVIDEVRKLLWRQAGPDFRLYKTALLERRLSQHMDRLGFASAAAYVALLHDDPAAVEDLRRDLLVAETSAFRDPPMWQALLRDIIGPLCSSPAPRREAGHASGPPRPLRVWAAACATGEEACSAALLLAQACAASGRDPDFVVFGTDIDERAIETARAARLQPGALVRAPVAGHERWLQQGPAGLQLDGHLRQRLVFGVHDVLADPPFSDIDLLLCRNLFLYLDDAGQREALAGFAEALAGGGWLVLGRDERLPEGLPGWQLVSDPHRIYRRVPESADPARPTSWLRAPGPVCARPLTSAADAGRLAEPLRCLGEQLQTVSTELHRVHRQMLEAQQREQRTAAQLRAAVAATAHPLLLLDEQGRLEYSSQSARQLFRLRPGDEGRLLSDFAHDLVWPEFAAALGGSSAGQAAPVTQEVQDIHGRHWLLTLTRWSLPAGLQGSHQQTLITAVDQSRLRETLKLQALIDALPQQVAVLDADGRIEHTNEAWHAFGRRHGASQARIEAGVDYLQASAPASGTTPEPDGERSARGIAEVLSGRTPTFRMRYACATPERPLWFQLDVSALAAPPGGCLVSHMDITDLMAPSGDERLA